MHIPKWKRKRIVFAICAELYPQLKKRIKMARLKAPVALLVCSDDSFSVCRQKLEE